MLQKTVFFNVPVLLCAILTLCLLAACSPAATKTVVAPLPTGAVATPSPEEEGIINFVSGEVLLLVGSAQQPVHMGDKVSANMSIRTGLTGSCDIKFRDHGAVHVAEKTTLVIKELSIHPDRKISEVELLSGSVTCKVNKMTTADRFQVRTGPVTAGVRGTVFNVRYEKGGNATIAVKEGKVALIPTTYHEESIRAVTRDLEKTKELDTVYTAITNHSLLVESGKEAVVKPGDLEQQEKIVAKVQEILAIPQTAAPTTSTAPSAALGQTQAQSEPVKLIDSITVPKTLLPTEISPESKDSFTNAAPTLSQVDLTVSKTTKATASEASAEAPEVVEEGEISIVTQPPEAAISINDTVIGKGGFSGLFNRKNPVKVQVSLEGYGPVIKTYDLSKADKLQETVSLTKLPPKPVIVKLTVTPSDAEVWFDGKKNGNGNTTLNIAADAKPVALSVRARGYENFEKNYGQGAPATEAIVLKAKPVYNTEKVSSAALGDLVGANGKVIYTADATGKLAAVQADVGVLWTAKTDNAMNENSVPVLAGNLVLFAGEHSLSAWDAASGKQRFSVALVSGDSGLFGRRPTIAGNQLWLTSEHGLTARKLSDGSVSSTVELPGGSDMTPAQNNGQLYTVTGNGHLVVVDAASGTIKKDIATKAVQPVATSPLVIGSKVFFADRKGLLVAVDTDTATVLYEKTIDSKNGSEVFCDLLPTGKNLLVFSKDTLYLLSQASGTIVFPAIHNVAGGACLSKGIIWYAGNDKTAYAIDAQSGKRRGSVGLGTKVSGKAEVSSTGLVAFPAEDGSLVFVNPVAVLDK